MKFFWFQPEKPWVGNPLCSIIPLQYHNLILNYYKPHDWQILSPEGSLASIYQLWNLSVVGAGGTLRGMAVSVKWKLKTTQHFSTTWSSKCLYFTDTEHLNIILQGNWNKNFLYTMPIIRPWELDKQLDSLDSIPMPSAGFLLEGRSHSEIPLYWFYNLLGEGDREATKSKKKKKNRNCMSLTC